MKHPTYLSKEVEDVPYAAAVGFRDILKPRDGECSWVGSENQRSARGLGLAICGPQQKQLK